MNNGINVETLELNLKTNLVKFCTLMRHIPAKSWVEYIGPKPIAFSWDVRGISTMNSLIINDIYVTVTMAIWRKWSY